MKGKIQFLAVVALLTLATACARREVALTTSADQPAAVGKAELTKDDNGNTVVDVQVKHLARPEDLTPAKNVYVVWLEPRGEAPINQGALQVGDDREGSLKVRTAHKNFNVFVTAEDSATATSPSGPEVMRQHIQR